MRLGDFIDRTLAAADVDGLVRTFKGALGEHGYEWMACGAIGGHAIYQSALPAPAVLVDYPLDWQRHYFDTGYVTTDPIVARAPLSRLPFAWGQLRDLSAVNRRMFNEAREAGLRNGAVVPIHGPSGEVFVTSVVSPYPEVRAERDLHVVNLLVNQFHTAYLGLVEPAIPQLVVLTQRERECLLWSARGKSSWDIGIILSISDNTVNFHLKNAMAKLDAGTRIMAIVKAIRYGLIAP